MAREYRVGIFGGFGNQLFQLNHIAGLQNTGHHVVADISLAASFSTPRNIEIIDLLEEYGVRMSSKPSLSRLYYNLSRILNAEKMFNLHYGYFHSEPIDEVLLSSLRSRYLPKRMMSESSVCLHVRGTDFINQHPQFDSLRRFYVSEIKAAMKQEHTIFYTTDDPKLFESLMSECAVDNSRLQSVNTFHELCGFKNIVCPESTYSTWAGIISGGTLIFPDWSRSPIVSNPSIETTSCNA